MREDEAVKITTEAYDDSWRKAGVTMWTSLNPTHAAAAYRAVKAEGVINQGWQPIESAPKDGTRILVWLKPLSQHEKINTDAQHSWVDKAHWTKFNGGGWVHYQLGTPTHWMPLPNPPIKE